MGQCLTSFLPQNCFLCRRRYVATRSMRQENQIHANRPTSNIRLESLSVLPPLPNLSTLSDTPAAPANHEAAPLPSVPEQLATPTILSPPPKAKNSQAWKSAFLNHLHNDNDDE